MLFELHGHTTRYSKCSQMSPAEYIQAARKKGLQGICLTEHNTFWPEDEYKRFCHQAEGLVVINGNEQRCWDGDQIQGDFLVFGCRFQYWEPTAAQLIELVHRQGGIIIAAHPFRAGLGVSEELIYQLDLDALEVYSCSQEPWQTKLVYQAAKKMNIPVIAASDTHSPELVGCSTTEFTVAIQNEQDFVQAINRGQFNLT